MFFTSIVAAIGKKERPSSCIEYDGAEDIFRNPDKIGPLFLRRKMSKKKLTAVIAQKKLFLFRDKTLCDLIHLTSALADIWVQVNSKKDSKFTLVYSVYGTKSIYEVSCNPERMNRQNISALSLRRVTRQIAMIGCKRSSGKSRTEKRSTKRSRRPTCSGSSFKITPDRRAVIRWICRPRGEVQRRPKPTRSTTCQNACSGFPATSQRSIPCRAYRFRRLRRRSKTKAPST